MSSREMWEVAWASTRASDVWFFVLTMVLLIAGVCIYYATGGDEEDRKEDYIFDPARHSSKFVAPRSLSVAKTLTKNKEK